MEIKFFGANCIRLQTKKVGVVIDDNLDLLGLSSVTKPNDIAIFTSKVEKPASQVSFFVDRPGEYEVLDVSIKGVPAQAHMDEPGQKNSTMYRLVIDDFKIGIIGHIYSDLTEEQLEALGMIDILFVPVGGHGYTLDAVGALKIIKKIGPAVVVPTHYNDSKIKYEVPQADLEEIRKALSMEPAEVQDELKLKGREFAEGSKLVILNRQ